MDARTGFKEAWNAAVFAATVAVTIETPVRFVLGLAPTGRITLWTALVTAIFSLDVAVGLFAPSPRGRQGYLRSFFVPDALAALPVPWLRPLKLFRAFSIFGKWQDYALLNPSLVRMLGFFFWMLLITNWVACGWIWLGGAPADLAAPSRYLRALYWTITTMATVGYGDITPQTDPQRIYAMLVMILGAGVYGYMIGNVAGLLANLDRAKADFSKKMDEVGAFLKYRAFPSALQKKIQNYYHYVWDNRLEQNEARVVHELPHSLRVEATLFLRRALVEKAPIFQDTEEEFKKEVVLRLHTVVYVPGDLIVRRGEAGDSMFFLSHGSVEVLSPDGSAAVAVLGAGSYFGEMSLVQGLPRSATVRAVGYCDVYRLDKKDFDPLLAKFPAFENHLRETILERGKKS